MISWTPYPKAEGEYAYLGDLILSAFPNGSWSVYRTSGGNRTSWMAPTYGPYDLMGAKAEAEKAANEMNDDLWA